MLDFGRLDLRRRRSNKEPADEGIEEPGSLRERTLRLAGPHHLGIRGMHGGRRPGQPLHLGRAAGVVDVTMGHEDMAYVGRFSAYRSDGLKDLRRASRDARVDQCQTVARVEEEGVDITQRHLPESWDHFLHGHDSAPILRPRSCPESPMIAHPT
jgi:hypothetical protein